MVTKYSSNSKDDNLKLNIGENFQFKNFHLETWEVADTGSEMWWL